MESTMPGIDYGRLTNTNRNITTGIHYGVISSHTIGQVWYDSAEPDYGPATCPKCAAPLADYDDWSEVLASNHESFDSFLT